MGMHTPWGLAETREQIAPGIVQVSTASHGGIHLDARRNALVHEAWRRKDGWYEEDCQWAIVARTFPKHFAEPMPGRDGTVADHADEVARCWFPDEYEIVNRVTVTAAESYVRAEQEIASAIVGELRSTSAWGYHNDATGRTRVPAGWIGVAANTGGRYRRHEHTDLFFLVPDGEYDASDHRAGVLIDPSRHPAWPALPAEPDRPVTVRIGPPQPADTFQLHGAADPHRGRAVGQLWRYPAAGAVPERWRAYRNGGGATLATFPDREEALHAVGLTLPPYAPVDDVDVDGVFGELLTT